MENPKAVVESVLFAMGNSVEIKKLADVLGMNTEETRELVLAMQGEWIYFRASI